MAEGILHGVFGYLVKDDPLGRFRPGVPLGRFLQVPRNGLALPVRVGGEEYIRGVIPGFFQLVQQRPLVLHHHVGRLKVLLDVDADLALGEVAEMPLGSGYHVLRAQDLADGPGLGGRLYYHQALAGRVQLLYGGRLGGFGPFRLTGLLLRRGLPGRSGFSDHERPQQPRI